MPASPRDQDERAGVDDGRVVPRGSRRAPPPGPPSAASRGRGSRSGVGCAAAVRAAPSSGARLDPRVADRLVQLRRLGERRDAQLAVEDGDARPVLADGRGAVARPRAAAPSAGGAPPRRAGRGRGGETRRRWRADVSPSASATSASRSSTAATLRSAATARVARQSSNSGLSRSEKPARNAPRASVGRRREDAQVARGGGVPRRRRGRRRAASSRATADRSIRSHRSPRAARSTDSVRRRAPRADSSSASGQRRAASSSRAYGRRSTARTARIARALRVSTTIGAPSTVTTSGSEHADPEPGARAGRCGHPRNGSATDPDPVTFAARHPAGRCRRRGCRAPLPPSAPP